MVVKFKFKYKGEDKEIDVQICKSVLNQARGLMFRSREFDNNLLFVFSGRRMRAIHSFFCKPFYAVWFDGENIVDEKLVDKWKLSIKPCGKFDRLLEIPVGAEEFKNLDPRKI